MYEKIYKEVKKESYFLNHKKVLIAVSGGVDSMNLLHFLYLYREKLTIEIGIAHINHKQRPESDAEECYLRQWAKEHSIPIEVSYFSGVFSEKTAREFRYRFFENIMEEKNYDALVTAHHADDQAETILMRLLRGSRLRHLSGITAVQPFSHGKLIRPFLTISKSDLPDIFHFEDSSNTSPDYFRNRIRNHYLPEMENENPQIKSALRELGKESQLVFRALRDLTATIDITNCQEFFDQSSAVQEILLQDYLEKFNDLQISKRQFQELLYLLRTKANVNYHIKSNYYLIKDYDTFKIKKISLKTDRSQNEKMLECDNIVRYGQYRFHFSKNQEIDNGIPLYSLSPIILRGRLPGDYISFGKFSKKIRRLFIDDKISSQDRDKAIIGVQNENIIFVYVANKTYLRKASKHDIMRAKLYIEN